MEFIRLRIPRNGMPVAGRFKIFDDRTGEQIVDVTSIVLYLGIGENSDVMKAMLNRTRGRQATLATVTRIETDESWVN